MIRFSKILFTNPADIWIYGIECSYDNIIKIFDIFECKWISLTIDSLYERSPLLELIKAQELKYFVKKQLNHYMELSVAVPSELFADIFKEAISESPENIFMYILLDPTNWKEQQQYSCEELVISGSTNACICISLDESALLISVNKSLLPVREIYKKIRALRLDRSNKTFCKRFLK